MNHDEVGRNVITKEIVEEAATGRPCRAQLDSSRGVLRAGGLLWVFMLNWLIVGLAGCATPQIARSVLPFTIEVRDAETRQLITNARVAARTTLNWTAPPFDPYAIDYMERHPGYVETRTDTTARAVIPVVILDRPYRVDWTIRADGYYSFGQRSTQPPLPQGTGPGMLPAVDPLRVAGSVYVHYMYRLPQPSIDLILPKGIRGPVFITTEQTSDLVQGTPGQRAFTLTVPANGHLHTTAAPLLALGPLNMYIRRVRYLDGADISIEHYAADEPTSWTVKDPKLVAFRLVRRFAVVKPATAFEGSEVWVTRWLYVVGTQADAAAMAARLGPEDQSDTLDNDTILRRARSTGVN